MKVEEEEVVFCKANRTELNPANTPIRRAVDGGGGG